MPPASLPGIVRGDVRRLERALGDRRVEIAAYRGPLALTLPRLSGSESQLPDQETWVVTFTGRLRYAKAHHVPEESPRVTGRFAYALYDGVEAAPLAFGIRKRPVRLTAG